jgi:class 3 adenylate cyclase
MLLNEDGPLVYIVGILGLLVVVSDSLGVALIQMKAQQLWIALYLAFSAALLVNAAPENIPKDQTIVSIVLWVVYFSTMSNVLFSYAVFCIVAMGLAVIGLGCSADRTNTTKFVFVFTPLFSCIIAVIMNRQRELCLRRGYRRDQQLQVMEHRHYLLLENCLHSNIAKLVRKGTAVNQEFPHAAIVFFTLHDFDYLMYQSSHPKDLFDAISAVTTKLDEIVLMYRSVVSKLEHVQGDYIVVSNTVFEVDATPSRISEMGALDARQLAVSSLLFLVRHILHYFQDEKNKMAMAFRVGLNVGPCLGAVVGKSRAFYRLFGDTVSGLVLQVFLICTITSFRLSLSTLGTRPPDQFSQPIAAPREAEHSTSLGRRVRAGDTWHGGEHDVQRERLQRARAYHQEQGADGDLLLPKERARSGVHKVG